MPMPNPDERYDDLMEARNEAHAECVSSSPDHDVQGMLDAYFHARVRHERATRRLENARREMYAAGEVMDDVQTYFVDRL